MTLRDLAVLVTITAAMSSSGAAASVTQNETQAPPPTQPLPRPVPAPDPDPSLPAALTRTHVTVVGCLYRAADVVSPVEAVGEDSSARGYILANVTLASGGDPAGGPMYKVDKIDQSKLEPLAGRHVEMAGRIDTGDADRQEPAAASGDQPQRASLPEFDAVSVRATSGNCPSRATTK